MQQLDQCIKCGNNHEGGCTTNTIYFYWHPIDGETANQVYIIGDWYQWVKKQKMNKKYLLNGKVYFSKLLALSEGYHEYKYLVDGEWKHDPFSPKIKNIYGSFNNIINVLPKKTYIQKHNGQQVQITSNICLHNLLIKGSWDNWKSERQMKIIYNQLKHRQQNVIYLDLQEGINYQFIFKYKNQYFIDQKYPTNYNDYGTLNNYIIVCQKNISVDLASPFKKNKSQQSLQPQIKGNNFKWKKIHAKIDLPYERVEGHAMCSIGEDLYIFGGKSRGQFYNSLITINSTFDKVKFQQAVPDGRAFHHMKVYGNRLLIYGGHNNSVLTDYHSFIVSDHKWVSSFSSLKTKQIRPQKQSCVIYHQLLVFFGGCYCNEEGQLTSIGNQLQVLNLQAMQWVESIKIQQFYPSGRFGHTAQTIGSNMYIFGGSKGKDSYLNDIWRINLHNVNHLKWQQITPAGKPPSPRYGHSMNTINKLILIFGGVNLSNQYLNDLYVYVEHKNQWIIPIVQGSIPSPRIYHASCIFFNDCLIIYGGRTKDKSKNKNFYILQPSQVDSVFTSIENFDDSDN